MGRVVGFGIVPALSLASSVLLLPLVAHRFGPGGWSSVSIGSSIGAYVGVLVGLSWPITGPHRIAHAQPEARKALYASSLRSRSLVFAVVLVPAIFLAVLLSTQREYQLATALVAVGIGLNGFTAAWYFAGLGTPWSLVRNEAAVRCAFYLIIICALSFGAPFWAYGLLLIASGLTMFAANWLSVLGARIPKFSSDLVETESVFDQAAGAAARFANSAFSTLTPVLFASSGVGGVPTFTALDQLQKTANNGLGALPQALIAFVSGSDRVALIKRLRLVILFGVVGSGVLIVGIAVGGPLVVEILYRGKVDPGNTAISVVAVTVGAAFLAQLLQQVVLVPLGVVRRSYVVMASVSVGAIPCFLVAVNFAGVLGGLATVAIAMGLVASSYLVLGVLGVRRLASSG